MPEDQTNLALILDHVGDGVTVQDRQGRLIYANAAAARSLGFAAPAELLSASVPEIISRYSMFTEDGEPFPPERLPGRRALAGERNAADDRNSPPSNMPSGGWFVIKSCCRESSQSRFSSELANTVPP